MEWRDDEVERRRGEERRDDDDKRAPRHDKAPPGRITGTEAVSPSARESPVICLSFTCIRNVVVT